MVNGQWQFLMQRYGYPIADQILDLPAIEVMARKFIKMNIINRGLQLRSLGESAEKGLP